MNGYIRRSAWFAATLLGWSLMVLVAGNAQGADEVMPPEVKAIIGMKLSPKVVGRKQAEIPGFHRITGALIGQDELQGNMLAYDEGVVGDKWPVFIVVRIASDQSAEILDAQMLPANLIEWRLVDGNRKYLEGRYRFSVNCKIEEEDKRLIMGLVKPEKGKSDCAHFSRRVKQAWQVDSAIRVSITILSEQPCHVAHALS